MSCSVTTWNLVPENSPIFGACQKGDLNAVKELFSEGSASPVDVDGNEGNLLTHAARGGHLDVCRFLLEETNLPASDEILLQALSAFAIGTWSSKLDGERMYRLLIEDFGMEIELDDRQARIAVALCPNEACVQLVTRNQAVSYRSRPVLQRLENAFVYSCYIVHPLTPGVLVQWTGESEVTPGLATFQAYDGCTALHIAASSMYSALRRNTDVGPWERFIQELICNGANLVRLSNRETPLLSALLECLRFKDDLETLGEVLYYWVSMLRSAGVNLVTYGKQENDVWQSAVICKSDEDSEDFFPVRLLFGSEPADWSVEVVEITKIRKYQLKVFPGSWHTAVNLPYEILWEPNWKEEMEGHWVLIDSIWVCSEPFDIRHGQVSRDEHFDDIMKSCQDDHGAIALRARPRACRAGPERRSVSQPPPIRRRAKAYLEDQQPTSHWWLCYHLCPLDNRWRLTCGSGDRTWNTPVSLRECLRGQTTSEVSVHDTTLWEGLSFMNDGKKPWWIRDIAT